MKLLAKANTVFDRITNSLAFVAGALIIFAMLSVSADVVMRYFFHRPVVWTMEAMELILLFITFLGAAWLLRIEGYIKVDIVSSRLNPRAQAFLGIVSSIIGIMVCVVFVWNGVQVSYDYFQRSIYDPTVLRLPKGPLLSIIAVGGSLLLIQFVRRGCGYFHSWRASPNKEERG